MKYVIVSVYDTGYGFEVCDNGSCKYKYDANDNAIPEFRAYNSLLGIEFNDWLKERFKDYDLIVVAEDGNVAIVKDTTKDNEFVCPSIIAEGEEDGKKK